MCLLCQKLSPSLWSSVVSKASSVFLFLIRVDLGCGEHGMVNKSCDSQMSWTLVDRIDHE
jgi:hypothetical protein